MADGIIGAISLGFQVTKELALYYSAFKSYNSDIQAVTKQIELVGNVFERLQATIQKLTVIPIQSTGELEALLVACAECLRQLEEYAHKCKKEKYTFECLKDRADMIIKRFAYPFRKNTLEGLQRTLDTLRGILQLMMHITQVDASKYWNEQVLIRHEYIQQALSAISAGQSANAVILHGLQMQLRSHTNALLEKHVETQHGIRNLSSQLDLVTSRLETLGRASNRPVQTDIPPLSDTTARWISKAPPMRRISEMNSLSQFTCSCSQKRSRGFRNGNCPTRFFRTSVSPHNPNCPLFLPSSVVTTRGVRFHLNLFKAAYFIEMGIEYGVSHIAPNIRYHNVVSSWSSPAFTLIEELYRYVRAIRRRGISYPISPGRLDAAFVLILRSLSQIYREGRAGIHDTDEYGQTICHMLLHFFSHDPIGLQYMSKATLNHTSDYFVVLNEMIRRFTDIGLDFNQEDHEGYTPLDDLLHTSSYSDVRAFLEAGIPALIELEHSWKNYPQVSKYRTTLVLQNYGSLVIYDSNAFVGHDTILSISQRSEVDLRKHLMNRHHFDEDTRDVDLISAAAKWPEGLRILFAHGISPYCLIDGGRTNVLDVALISNDFDVLRVLLELDTLPISYNTWRRANAFYESWKEDTDLPKKVLFRLADQLSDRFHNETTAARNQVHGLYYIGSLTVTGAQALYDRGLQDVDSHDKEGLTPFYCFSRDYAYYKDPKETSIYRLQWLYNHGALVNACHPKNHTRVSHFLAKATVRYIALGFRFKRTVLKAKRHVATLLDGHNAMLVEVFSDSTKDECVCYCSSDGCNIATSALNSLRRTWDYWPQLAMKDRIVIFTAISSHLEIDIDQEPEQVLSILRLMTFEILGMTHTCHSHDLTSDSPEEDISVYLHIEAQDAQLLDDLMGEFDMEWSEFDGSFLDFIEHQWEPRMEEVLAERNATPTNEKELQELGVSLNVLEKDTEKKSKVGPEDHWTFFQRRVKAIVDNEEHERWM